MEIMERTRWHVASPLPADWEEGRDQAVLLHGITWEQYEELSRARGEYPRPLMAYLDGELELVTTSTRHEFVKKMVARLLEAYAEERGVPLNGFGMATRRRKAKQAGAEPDEQYSIGRSGRGSPDLAVEIVFTSGGIDKLEIYRRLKVAEVWFWIDDRFWIYRLFGSHFEPVDASVAVPDIDLGAIAKIIATTDETRQTEAVRAYRRSLRRRR
jgi:Uma2 family endonuclease